MSTPVIDGPASVTPADTTYPADDGCRISETREWIWDADQWEFTSPEQSEGRSAWTFSHCRAVPTVGDCDQIYPPGPPCSTVPEVTTTTPNIVSVGNDAQMTQGMMAGGALLLVAGLFAVVVARRRTMGAPAE